MWLVESGVTRFERSDTGLRDQDLAGEEDVLNQHECELKVLTTLTFNNARALNTSPVVGMLHDFCNF